MDRKTRESYNNMLRVLLIWIIRVYPILTCIALMVNYAELIHVVNAGEAVEYYDGGTLLYVQYETTFSDAYLAPVFSSSLLTCFLFYMLSKVFLFCIYHRVFIFAMLVNQIVSIVNDMLVYDSINVNLTVSYLALSFTITCFMVALYLHQKYGDRKLDNHTSIKNGYRNANYK